jgi:hypothetical protein
MYTPALTHAPTPLTAEDMFLEQLRTFAEQARSVSESSTREGLPYMDSISVSDSEYDTDETDYLTPAKTPCPLREYSSRPRKTGLQSHNFSIAKSKISKTSVQRKLYFEKMSHNTSKKTTPRLKETQFSLEKLKNIERSPRRAWDSEERQLLLVLHRWYWSSDRYESLLIVSVCIDVKYVALHCR